MEALFSQDYWMLWAVVLALALFFPVRQLIYALYLRRAGRKGIEIDQNERNHIKTRSGYTAGLLCFVFAVLYTMKLFRITL